MPANSRWDLIPGLKG